MFQNATCKFGVINFFGQNLFVTTIAENRYKNIVPNDTIIYTLREWGSFLGDLTLGRFVAKLSTQDKYLILFSCNLYLVVLFIYSDILM